MTHQNLSGMYRKRRQIVDAAIACLGQKEGDTVTLGDIAEQAELSYTQLLQYYSSRNHLFADAYRWQAHRLLDELLLAAAAAGESPGDRLGGYLLASFQAPNLERGLLAVWLHFWAALPTSSEVRHVHDETWTRYHMELYRLLNAACHDNRRGFVHRDINQIALGVSALLDGLWLEWSLDHNRLDPEDGIAITFRFVEAVTGIDLELDRLRASFSHTPSTGANRLPV